MEKELFELMTKMYSEMKEGFSDVGTRLDKVENRLDKVEKEVSKTNVVIENEIKPRIEALFDGYKQNTEAINILEDEVRELRVSVNELNIKTIKHENNIIAFSKQIRKLEH